MNPFGIVVTKVRGDIPVGGVIPARQLDEYISVAGVLARARSTAADVLCRARRRRAELAEAAARRLEAARVDGEARAEAAARAAHDATCRDVVTWLVAERELEASVAQGLAARLRGWVSETVTHFAGEADRAALVAARIDAQIRQLSAHGVFSVRVCPDEYDAVASRLPRDVSFELICDSAMGPGQALLDSPFVQLRIDLERHLRELLVGIGAPGMPSDAADPPASDGGGACNQR
jgi:flagellar biosynthesis/type III secretory pathway protein FliH